MPIKWPYWQMIAVAPGEGRRKKRSLTFQVVYKKRKSDGIVIGHMVSVINEFQLNFLPKKLRNIYGAMTNLSFIITIDCIYARSKQNWMRKIRSLVKRPFLHNSAMQKWCVTGGYLRCSMRQTFAISEQNNWIWLAFHWFTRFIRSIPTFS